MKNLVPYDGLSITERNVVSIEKLLFRREREKQIKPKIKFSNQLASQVVDHIKGYLTQSEYRPLIRDSFGNQQKKKQLRSVIHSHVSSKEFLEGFSAQITDYSLDEISDILIEKIAGLGILQQFAEIETITDIKCHSYNNIWVDDIYKGKYKTDAQFDNEQEYLELCHRFAFASSKSISVSVPAVEAHFPYMRVSIVAEDISPDVSLSIRIISKKLRYDEETMLKSGYANKDIINILKRTFLSESHLISGATGTGKTENLRYFTQYTKDNGEIIMIEDTPETYLAQLYPNKPIRMWRNRESLNQEKQSFGYKFHVRNAMRHDPDYIFIQESRGAESGDILKAATTGHVVNTTLHANSAVIAVNRFIDLCQEDMHKPTDYYGGMIVSGFPIGVHIKRFNNVRRINQLIECVDFADGKLKANVLVEWDVVQGKHIQQDKMSVSLWNRLSEEHDMNELESFKPDELILLDKQRQEVLV